MGCTTAALTLEGKVRKALSDLDFDRTCRNVQESVPPLEEYLADEGVTAYESDSPEPFTFLSALSAATTVLLFILVVSWVLPLFISAAEFLWSLL